MRGIIYCMTTVVPGLVKIGKTNSDNFTQRMYQLEHNGYNNVVGLQRQFAIEVDDYDQKELMLHKLFRNSQVGETELFSLDISLVIQLLSSLNGDIIYPKTNEIKQEIAHDIIAQAINDDIFYFNRKDASARAVFNKLDNTMVVLKGSTITTTEAPSIASDIHEWREKLMGEGQIINHQFMVDYSFSSPSRAAAVIGGASINGRDVWKNAQGKTLKELTT